MPSHVQPCLLWNTENSFAPDTTVSFEIPYRIGFGLLPRRETQSNISLAYSVSLFPNPEQNGYGEERGSKRERLRKRTQIIDSASYTDGGSGYSPASSGCQARLRRGALASLSALVPR